MSRPPDSIEVMNDHMARFFRHADQLLTEWKEYGDRLRGSIDAEAEHLRASVAEAMRTAGQEAGANIDMERALGNSLVRLRREVDQLASKVSAAKGGVGLGNGRWVLVGVAAANAMLIVMLVMSVRGCRSQEQAEPAAGAVPSAVLPSDAAVPVDAAPAVDAAPSAAQSACLTLDEGATSEEVRAFVGAAAAELCGPQAGQAETIIDKHLVAPKKKGKRGGSTGRRGKN